MEELETIRDPSKENLRDSKEKSQSALEDHNVYVTALIRKRLDHPEIRNIPTYCQNQQSALSAIKNTTDKIYVERREVVLLERKSIRRKGKKEENSSDRDMAGQDDKKTKMAICRELEVEMLSVAHPDDGGTDCSASADYENMEILQKLPAGTIVIKRPKLSKDDSDYVKDSTETNSSGGSSTTSGYAAGKVKRIHRAIRNRNRVGMDVRRNSTRMRKKDANADLSRPRQRLLSAKKKESLSGIESIKRTKLSTMPYMNTRSVTRKMYNVGATYQAPSIKDETEWKEWPVHGMHERPVFHPRAGLAAEYLGKYYTSLDGYSYQEIIDPLEIEVVSVDPRCECPTSSSEKKRGKKAKVIRETPRSIGKVESTLLNENKSFEICMHGSLHSVLGYCSQVMTPSYQHGVEEKLIESERDDKPVELTTRKNDLQIEMKENQGKHNITNESKEKAVKENRNDSLQIHGTKENSLENYTIAVSPNIRNSMKNSPLRRRVLPMQAMTGLGSSLILVKTSDGKVAECYNAATRDRILKMSSADLNITKLEDTSISDETLMEMSSMYKNLMSNNDLKSDHNNSNVLGRNLSGQKKSLVKRGNQLTEFAARKCLFAEKEQEKVGDPHECQNKYIQTTYDKAWQTNETSEIARILSEYNRSNTRKSAIQSHGLSTVTRCSNPNISVFTDSNDSCNTNALLSLPKHNIGEKNSNVNLLQGKWRKFHFTVEKLKESRLLDLRDKGKNVFLGYQRSSLLPTNNTNINQVVTDTNFEIVENETVSSASKSQHLHEKKQALNQKDNTSINTEEESKVRPLQELLENTAVLYCAATSVHQSDLVNYIDNLDAKQSIQWLETWDNSVV
ncbi:hypothetical protein KM043_012814 [Ampulex compressa]|nr:hypothetical protein KM043_012814 [Ampulex compressa]